MTTNILRDMPKAQARECITLLRAVPLVFDIGGHHCEWLGWGFNPDRCRDRGHHSHSFFEACYVYRGRGTFALEDEVHHLRPGQMFLSRPGQVHFIDTHATNPMGIYFWYFTLSPNTTHQPDADGTAALLAGFCRAQRIITNAAVSLRDTLAMLLTEMTAPSAGYFHIVQALTRKLLLDTARAASDAVPSVPKPDLPPGGPADAILREAQRFLRDNLHRPIGVQDAAAQVHVSPRHLTRLFRQHANQSPLQHLTAIRMQAAQTLLLRHRDQSIKQIALQCGYSDPRHFNQVFHKHARLTPTAYRKSHGVKFTRA